MSKADVFRTYNDNSKAAKLADSLLKRGNKVHIKGLAGSSLSFVLSSAFKQNELPFLIIFNDKEEAAYHLNDLEQMVGDEDVLF